MHACICVFIWMIVHNLISCNYLNRATGLVIQLGIKGYMAQLAEGDNQVCQETEVTQVFKEILERMVFLDRRGIMVNLANQEV